MYPKRHKNVQSLQSKLFGHRLKSGQTKYEYLIEFLQVAIAEKASQATEEPLARMFPVNSRIANENIKYYPETHVGLKRFIFFPKSKLEGKAEVDKQAYQACLKAVEDKMAGGSKSSRQENTVILQSLLSGFGAVTQNRSWFDQNMLPLCKEVILPESMGEKKDRQGLVFEVGKSDIDSKFQYKKYTYMCRGGEIYYLHLLRAIQEYPQYQDLIESRLNKLLDQFPQFSYLCNFVETTWKTYMQVTEEDQNANRVSKDLASIPLRFDCRNKYTLTELENFLNSKAHPFEKVETLANGIILQILRMMYVSVNGEPGCNCWIMDLTTKDIPSPEVKKSAIGGFQRNEETFQTYLNREYKTFAVEQSGETKFTEQKTIQNAAEDSYRLFRKLGKMIGVIIPATGPNMRFSLSEDILKFLVLALIPPKEMITLDAFMDCLYRQYGMVIGQEQYQHEMNVGTVPTIGDLSFFDENKKAFAQKLKDCGFLRDLSDAISIVENPYEKEGV